VVRRHGSRRGSLRMEEENVPASVKKVDEATTVALVNAFNTAVNDLNSARQTVDASSMDLQAGWLGAASQKYQEGLVEIRTGLQNVGQALNQLTDDMQRFAAASTNREDDATAQAASVALSTWT